MLLKEAETVEDGASSCSDLFLLDFSPFIQFSFVVFCSLDSDNASIVAVPTRLLKTRPMEESAEEAVSVNQWSTDLVLLYAE